MRQTVLEDLALKTLYLAGPISVLDLSQQMRLGFDLTNELFFRMRTDLLCHVTGMRGNIPAIAITSQGRARALELLSQNQYTGPAPVSLENYVVMVRRQSVRNMVVHRGDVERAFAHLVIDDKTLSQFGTALNSGAAIFLHAHRTLENPQLPKPWRECLPRTPYGCPTQSRSMARSLLSMIR